MVSPLQKNLNWDKLVQNYFEKSERFSKINGVMAVLFITHKFPPATGGMEKFSYELYRSMQQNMPVHIIAYEGKSSRILWFYN